MCAALQLQNLHTLKVSFIDCKLVKVILQNQLGNQCNWSDTWPNTHTHARTECTLSLYCIVAVLKTSNKITFDNW